ncbi:MAG: Glutamyl-tRNA(Gln) amidotransferase subunit, partial [Planctomycetota bacterium]
MKQHPRAAIASDAVAMTLFAAQAAQDSGEGATSSVGFRDAFMVVLLAQPFSGSWALFSFLCPSWSRIGRRCVVGVNDGPLHRAFRSRDESIVAGVRVGGYTRDMNTPFSSIALLAQQFRDGLASPVEIVEQCLQEWERSEPSIHAWVWLDPDGARRQAEQMARQLRAGDALGPLAGIPIGVKDIIDMRGLPTRAGSPIRSQHVAEQDAPVVVRLRQAGAILLGKTVTTEFACFDPPPTRNPWNHERTPGGSSSGSAAAVSLGM